MKQTRRIHSYAVPSMRDKGVSCNMCGKRLRGGREKKYADYLRVQKEWNYFSGLDQSRYEFCLCEDCFRTLIGRFRIPAHRSRRTELL